MDNCSQRSVQIGSYDASLPGTENKMVLCSDGLITLGIPALKQCTLSKSDWVSIDEIGYLESECKEYQNAIRDLLERKQVAAVVRKQELSFLRELCSRNDVFLVDLDRPLGNYGCVIMASGLGKRFGSNKLMADFCGEPLICRILDSTEGLFARRVVVTRHETVVSLCHDRNIDVITHDLPHRSDTVKLGLEAVGNVDGCMFCPSDQPLLSRATIETLVFSAVQQPDLIWRTCYGDIPGAPVLFPQWTFPELLDLPIGKGGSWVIDHHPEHLSLARVPDRYELMDADTPAALDLLQHLYQEKKTRLN